MYASLFAAAVAAAAAMPDVVDVAKIVALALPLRHHMMAVVRDAALDVSPDRQLIRPNINQRFHSTKKKF